MRRGTYRPTHPAAVHLGAELAAARRALGLTQEDVAEQLGKGKLQVYRWEHGQLPKREDFKDLCEVIHVRGDLLAQLSRLFDEARTDDWRSGDPGPPGYDLAVYTWQEANASRVQTVSSLFVPGLLQTKCYAQTILEGNPDNTDVDRAVRFRIQCQQVLTREERPLQLDAYITDAALLNQPVPPHVAIEQCDHILSEAERPNIDVRIVQVRDAPLLIEGTFTVLSFERVSPVVWNETFRLAQASSHDIAGYMNRFRLIRKKSCTAEEAPELIRGIRRKWELSAG